MLDASNPSGNSFTAEVVGDANMSFFEETISNLDV